MLWTEPGLTEEAPFTKVKRLSHLVLTPRGEIGFELLRKEGNDCVDVRLHARHGAGGPVFGDRLLHAAVFRRADLTEDVVDRVTADLEATDCMPVGLPRGKIPTNISTKDAVAPIFTK